MLKELKKRGIIRQVAILFAIGIILTGMTTFTAQHTLADSQVRGQLESIASATAGEVSMAIREYPAYKWLLNYWYDNYEDLDVEYDVTFTEETVTEQKCRAIMENNPGFQPRYASEEEVKALDPEYQKLYAEVVYSWFITRLDQIKLTYNMDYLFGVVTEEPYENQFFLFSAADPGAVRGTNYEEVYTLGVQSTVSGPQKDAMKSAVKDMNYLAAAGEYMDYYSLFETGNEHALLIGMTFNLSDIRANVKKNTSSGMISATMNQLIMALICLLLLFYWVLKPLKEVIENIQLYKENKNSKEIAANLSNVNPRNEIGQLSKDITSLAEEMDNYHIQIENITAEKERISTELELASRIQAATLPSKFPAFPERKEFDVFASMTPAKEVGGDFYDFYLIDDDHIAIVMADVSGKGVPAALFMMVSKILLENHAKQGKSPSKIITDVNNAICSNNREEMFVTVWLGILEISTGRLTYTNAGHEYPAIRQGDGSFEIIKERHGFIVGGMGGVNYREGELTLKPGSRIFLYTDGVPEATAADKSMFGMERMEETLNNISDDSPESIVNGIKDAVAEFVGEAEQFDDLTVLCLSYEGPEK